LLFAGLLVGPTVAWVGDVCDKTGNEMINIISPIFIARSRMQQREMYMSFTTTKNVQIMRELRLREPEWMQPAGIQLLPFNGSSTVMRVPCLVAFSAVMVPP
jgi:hypothetical protein